MEKVVLAYDSECQMCVRFKKGIELLDKNSEIEFISVHDDSLYFRYPQLKKDECVDIIHLVDTEGKVHTGGDVIKFLVKIFPTAEKFAWLIDSNSTQKAMNIFYSKVNEYRKKSHKNCPKCNKTKTRG